MPNAGHHLAAKGRWVRRELKEADQVDGIVIRRDRYSTDQQYWIVLRSSSNSASDNKVKFLTFCNMK
jgi:hypothetical protein